MLYRYESLRNDTFACDFRSKKSLLAIKITIASQQAKNCFVDIYEHLLVNKLLLQKRSEVYLGDYAISRLVLLT